MKSIFEVWNDTKEILRKRRELGEPEFPTGLSFIDDMTGGIQRGEIWVIAGKTGAGKTSLALQIARSVANNPNNSVLIISLEMSKY